MPAKQRIRKVRKHCTSVSAKANGHQASGASAWPQAAHEAKEEEETLLVRSGRDLIAISAGINQNARISSSGAMQANRQVMHCTVWWHDAATHLFLFVATIRHRNRYQETLN